MKAVQVTYTTTAVYSAQNQANIKKVMDDLQRLGQPGLFYHTCMLANGQTFIHTAFFEPAENEQVLFALESFKNFQQQLKASAPQVAPKQEILTLIGSSKKKF